MNGLRDDLRQAVRLLSQSPAFSATVVLTLGLGIGANTAIFTLLDRVLLRPLPVRAPEELVVLHAPGPTRGSIHRFSDFSAPLSYPLYRDLRDGVDAFEGVLARLPVSVNLTQDGVTDQASGELVSGNYFTLLGVGAAVGRVFTPEDDVQRLGHPVAVLSHGFWTRRFGADPRVVGREVRLNGHVLTAVGVAAPGFHGIEIGRATDVFVPMQMKPWMTPTWDALDDRRTLWVNAMARLKPGVSVEAAAAAADVVYRQALESEAGAMSDLSPAGRERFVSKHLELLPGARGRSDLRGQFGAQLQALMVMVGLVLLIACANVANLLLARAAARRREIAVRLALGASRGRIVRQLLAESLLLALLGGAAGLLLAGWTVDALLAALPVAPGTLGFSGAPDGRVLAFSLVVSVAAALLFGLLPALQTSRPALADPLREQGGALLGSHGQARLRRTLIVAEVALSLLLLATAGLFARSLRNLRAVDTGFDVRGVISFTVQPVLAGYDRTQTQVLVERVLREVQALPGVATAAAADLAVLTNSDSTLSLNVDGYAAQEGESVSASFNFVTPGYFASLGVPVLRGRGLGAQDAAGAARVAVVNETFVRRFYGSGDALGRHFGIGRASPQSVEIVGVVRDSHYRSLREDVPPVVYVPRAQLDDGMGSATFYVRAAGVPGTAFVDALRAAVRRVDVNLPLVFVASLPEVIDQALYVERLTALLAAAFGVLAALLAGTGLYAVLSFSVARRTREIGLRMALGAERRAVLRLVLGDVLVLGGAGIALGLPAALVLGRLVEAQLFGLGAADPAALAAAAAALLGVVLAAAWLPAQRATAVDPVTALRVE